MISVAGGFFRLDPKLMPSMLPYLFSMTYSEQTPALPPTSVNRSLPSGRLKVIHHIFAFYTLFIRLFCLIRAC
jgi:hypothetical protein